jgi:hypothetical protein
VQQNTLLQLFNTRKLEDVMLCETVPELDNALNRKLRDAIETLRMLNELYYLPVRVIDLYSREYEEQYG